MNNRNGLRNDTMEKVNERDYPLRGRSHCVISPILKTLTVWSETLHTGLFAMKNIATKNPWVAPVIRHAPSGMNKFDGVRDAHYV